MKEQPVQNIETINFSVFKDYFPDAEISEINLDEIPDNAMKYFEGKSAAFILPENYKPRNFDKSYIVNHRDGSKTYLVEQIKTYGNIDETEKLTYFVDINNEERLGHSELRFNIKCAKKNEEYFKNKPFIGFTYTEEAARRTGLGMRRVFMMNAYAQMKYGFPIYSDTVISEGAKKMWEKLVKQGKAEKFKEGPHNRYVLKIEKNQK